jgi:hypothetical protein
LNNSGGVGGSEPAAAQVEHRECRPSQVQAVRTPTSSGDKRKRHRGEREVKTTADPGAFELEPPWIDPFPRR